MEMWHCSQCDGVVDFEDWDFDLEICKWCVEEESTEEGEW